jgi:hypothetical protein
MYFTTLNQQNAYICYIDICITISHLAFLYVSVRKGSSSGNQTKVTQHKINMVYVVFLLYAVSLSFNSLKMFPCGPKHTGMISVIL